MSGPNEGLYGIVSTEPVAAKDFSAQNKQCRAVWVRTPGTLAVTYYDGTTDTFTAADFAQGQIYPMIGVKAITGTPTLVGKICY